MSIVEGNAFGDILKEFHPRQEKHGGIANRTFGIAKHKTNIPIIRVMCNLCIK